VVLWDCDNCHVSKYGLNFRRIVNWDNGQNGDASYGNIVKAFNKFLSRAKMATGWRGWFENKAAWTEFNFLGIVLGLQANLKETSVVKIACQVEATRKRSCSNE
jgi:hypothetical protein